MEHYDCCCAMVGEVDKLRRCLQRYIKEVAGIQASLSKSSSALEALKTQFKSQLQVANKAQEWLCVESGKHILKLRDWEQESQTSISILRMKYLELDASFSVIQDLLVRVASFVNIPPHEMLLTNCVTRTHRDSQESETASHVESVAASLIGF